MKIKLNEREAFFKKILNSNDIKLLFTVSTIWPTTRKNYCKDSSKFTLWTPFIHQNVPFSKATQFRILKLKTIYFNHQICYCHFHIKRTKLWPNFWLCCPLPKQTSLPLTNYLAGMEIWRGHTSSLLIFWLLSLPYFFIFALRKSFKFLRFQGNVTSKKMGFCGS